MKKFLSMVCVLALALAICVPAFADATPGQATAGQVENAAAAAISNPTYANGKAVADAVKADSNKAVYGSATAAMKAVLTRVGVAKNYGFSGISAALRAYVPADMSGTTLNVAMTTPANNAFTITASFAGDAQSDLGVYMVVSLPASAMDTSKTYFWANENGEYGNVEVIVNDTVATFGFWAPHFSDYTISPNLPSSGSAAAAPSILARTNADINLTVVIAAAMALVLTAGSAVVLKKRGLSK